MNDFTFPNCDRYFKKDFDRLRYQFSGSQDIENNYSQAFQDIFVLSMLSGKKREYTVNLPTHSHGDSTSIACSSFNHMIRKDYNFQDSCSLESCSRSWNRSFLSLAY